MQQISLKDMKELIKQLGKTKETEYNYTISKNNCQYPITKYVPSSVPISIVCCPRLLPWPVV